MKLKKKNVKGLAGYRQLQSPPRAPRKAGDARPLVVKAESAAANPLLPGQGLTAPTRGERFCTLSPARHCDKDKRSPQAVKTELVT